MDLNLSGNMMRKIIVIFFLILLAIPIVETSNVTIQETEIDLQCLSTTYVSFVNTVQNENIGLCNYASDMIRESKNDDTSGVLSPQINLKYNIGRPYFRAGIIYMIFALVLLVILLIIHYKVPEN